MKSNVVSKFTSVIHFVMQFNTVCLWGVIYQHFTSVWLGQSVYQICSKDRTRAGSVGFFNFGWIRFGFQSQVLGFVFFGFGIHISPQCKSILVCENTNTESTRYTLAETPLHSVWSDEHSQVGAQYALPYSQSLNTACVHGWSKDALYTRE